MVPKLKKIVSVTSQSWSQYFGEQPFTGDLAEEGQAGVFWTDLMGAEPMGYRWFRAYPWETNWVEVTGATNWYFVITNVDSWVNGSKVMCLVSNGAGESVWLGPEYLYVSPVPASIPAINYTTGQGPASRYPMTIRVFDQPTNFNRVSVIVTLWGLTHDRSADLSILLVSPSGKQIMLMSNVGWTNRVANGSITFDQSWPPPNQSGPLLPPNGYYVIYRPSNYGQVTQMPQVGSDPPPFHTGTYSANLDDLQYDNPNGVWKLYIYDFYQQRTGELTGSWQLNFDFE
jgi:subtilisin-like proprotein convertase family protein